MGEHKAKVMVSCWGMARRILSPQREQLTKDELSLLREKLTAMSRSELEIYYKASHNACRYNVRVPSPRLIQELVQAWKAIRKVAR